MPKEITSAEYNYFRSERCDTTDIKCGAPYSLFVSLRDCSSGTLFENFPEDLTNPSQIAHLFGKLACTTRSVFIPRNEAETGKVPEVEIEPACRIYPWMENEYNMHILFLKGRQGLLEPMNETHSRKALLWVMPILSQCLGIRRDVADFGFVVAESFLCSDEAAPLKPKELVVSQGRGDGMAGALVPSHPYTPTPSITREVTV